MKNILVFLFMSMLLISAVSSLDYMKPAKLNSEYTIIQTCASCSYVNISISNTNGFVENNVNMENNGSGIWTYSITPTESGRYDVTGIGDVSGTDTSFATYFEVTGDGFIGTLGFYILIFAMGFGLVFLGYYAQDATIVLFGSFAFVFLGLYCLFYGIDGIKDSVYTWGISIILLGTSAYLMVKSSQEFLN